MKKNRQQTKARNRTHPASLPQREVAKLRQTPKDQIVVRKGNGKNGHERDLGGAVFPLLKEAKTGEVELIGTAFFIHHQGIFVTAKHVLMDVYDTEKKEFSHGIFAIQLLPNNTYISRGLVEFTIHDNADIGIGRLHPMKHNTTKEPLYNQVVSLSFSPVKVGDQITTYAYPNTVIKQKEREGEPNIAYFWPAFYSGYVVEEYTEGRDRVMLPNPCYQTSMTIHGGASGGPVFNKDGKVCGINSTGYPDMLDVSFISRINEILPLKANGIKPDENSEPTSFSVFEMIQLGQITID